MQTELAVYAQRIFPQITPEQVQDLIYLSQYHEAGLCASRGYGKTLVCAIYETFMASRGWKVAHLAKEMSQLDQWYIWMEKLGWKTTQWYAYRGRVTVDIRIYKQGRGPRYDVVTNDEVGTVITEMEQRHFMQSQEMLSGSKLGKSCWIGTQDPNSVWVKCKHQSTRGYDPTIMPWVIRQYESAKRKNPMWYMDQEYHCLATPAGGLVLKNLFLQDHNYASTKYGIDTNPSVGTYVVGTHTQPDRVYVCECYCFTTLESLGNFVQSKYGKIPFELEMNGPGGVVANYLRERHLSFYEEWTKDNDKDEADKTARVTAWSVLPTYIPYKFEGEFYHTLLKQIWDPKTKKIMKFSDAHWFDATWLSVGQAGVIDVPNYNTNVSTGVLGSEWVPAQRLR